MCFAREKVCKFDEKPTEVLSSESIRTETINAVIMRKVVAGGRIELPTRGFSVLCSTTELPGHNAANLPNPLVLVNGIGDRRGLIEQKNLGALQKGKRLFHRSVTVHDAPGSSDKTLGVFVLKGIAPHGKPGTTGIHRAADHLERFFVGQL